MSTQVYKIWRTTAHNAVALKKGRNGFYLLLNYDGWKRGETATPYFFKENIWHEGVALYHAKLLISMWEQSVAEPTPVQEQKPTALKGLRLFFSESLINEAGHLVAISSVLMKDEREHHPMAIVFKDLLEANKVPADTKYLWLARPNQNGAWTLLKAVELVTPRSIKRIELQLEQITAIYCNS